MKSDRGGVPAGKLSGRLVGVIVGDQRKLIDKNRELLAEMRGWRDKQDYAA